MSSNEIIVIAFSGAAIACGFIGLYIGWQSSRSITLHSVSNWLAINGYDNVRKEFRKKFLPD